MTAWYLLPFDAMSQRRAVELKANGKHDDISNAKSQTELIREKTKIGMVWHHAKVSKKSFRREIIMELNRRQFNKQ